MELFDSVWQTIQDTYPDTTFNSIDWNRIGDKYRAQLVTTTNKDSIIELLSRMLFELNVSHAFIGHKSQIEQKASPYMFKPGSPGFDIRILADLVVVTRVESGSDAEIMNLLPGSIITQIDNNDVGNIISTAPIYPPYNDRYKRFLQTEEILRHLYGEVGSSVLIDYIDKGGNLGKTQIVRMARNNTIQLAFDIPPIHLECEWKILKNNIGYLRFNAFQPENPVTVLSAIDSLFHTNSIVVDLRGNNGGSNEAQRNIAGRFFDKLVAGAIIESRDWIDTMFYNGNQGAYTGPVAILVDEVSISGAELFPATLQSLNRAVIVGSHTPGAVMGGTIEFLDDDLVFLHPTQIIKTIEGRNLEGIGVIPDIIVPLDKELLSIGVDSQLETAIKHLQQKIPMGDY